MPGHYGKKKMSKKKPMSGKMTRTDQFKAKKKTAKKR
jgi:hypothetical protein